MLLFSFLVVLLIFLTGVTAVSSIGTARVEIGVDAAVVDRVVVVVLVARRTGEVGREAAVGVRILVVVE